MSDAAIVVSAGVGAGLFVLMLAAPGFALVASHRRDRRRFAEIRALSQPKGHGGGDG